MDNMMPGEDQLDPSQMSEQQRAMLVYLMGAGADQPQLQQITRQRAMLDRLRQSAQVPTGDYTQTGAGTPSIYVAPNPLQNLAGVLGAGVTGYGENVLNKRSTEIGQGNVNRFAEMVQRLRGKKASANMGSSGNTLTTDLPGGVGAQPY
jgi:hypothetical protein